MSMPQHFLCRKVSAFVAWLAQTFPCQRFLRLLVGYLQPPLFKELCAPTVIKCFCVCRLLGSSLPLKRRPDHGFALTNKFRREMHLNDQIHFIRWPWRDLHKVSILEYFFTMISKAFQTQCFVQGLRPQTCHVHFPTAINVIPRPDHGFTLIIIFRRKILLSIFKTNLPHDHNF